MEETHSLDSRLLTLLRRNARASITELAGHLKVSRATVASRLNGLTETGRIRRFTIETDRPDAGTVRAVMLIELEGPLARSVARSLTKIPGIAELHTTSGDWDLVAMVETFDLAGFDQLLRQVREVRGVINSRTQILLKRE